MKAHTKPWMRLLPGFVQRRLEGRDNLQNILANIGWLSADRILRMGVGFFVGLWVARYLGPEQFGLLNFAMAFVALFGAVATLGLRDIVVRDMVREPARAAQTLGTSFVLQLAGGLVAFLLVIGTVSYLRPDDTLAKAIIAILGFTLILKASEPVKYWFESQVQSKYTVWAENGIFLIIAAIEVGMILAGAPLIAFVWAAFAQAAGIALALLTIYAWKGGRLAAWQPTLTRAKALLGDSWPLILSGLAVMVYLRIDQLMLGQMVGDEAVGIYSAAVRISEVWYFIPMAVVASVFPAIIEAKKQGETLYNQRFQKLYDLMVLLALVVALPMTFLSDWVVVLLFGQPYASAGPVLAIHIWAALFVFLGVASSKWIIAENRQILNFQRTLLGAVVNVVLNFFLIPALGIFGAAYATVISQATAAFIFDVMRKETRPMFIMKLRSMNVVRSARSLV